MSIAVNVFVVSLTRFVFLTNLSVRNEFWWLDVFLPITPLDVAFPAIEIVVFMCSTWGSEKFDEDKDEDDDDDAENEDLFIVSFFNFCII